MATHYADPAETGDRRMAWAETRPRHVRDVAIRRAGFTIHERAAGRPALWTLGRDGPVYTDDEAYAAAAGGVTA